jgi:hypothetical protein
MAFVMYGSHKMAIGLFEPFAIEVLLLEQEAATGTGICS